MAEKNEKKEEQAKRYTKKQLLGSKRYLHQRDVAMAILTEDGLYTLKEVDSLIQEFMKGKVK